VARDFNGDGVLDMAVLNSAYPSPSMSVLLGNGDGTFQPPLAPFALGTFATGMSTADFNRDGKLDLAVLDGDNGGISILLGNGDGTFQSGTFISLSYFFQFVIGDFNGDGNVDLAVMGQPTSQYVLDVFLGNGDGTFQPALSLPGFNANDLVAADVNGDGKLDLIGASSGYYGAKQGTVSVALGNGDGTFQPAQTYAGVPTPYPAIIGDFNGDGKPDLVQGDQYGLIGVLLGNGDGTFQPFFWTAAETSASALAAGDFNGDGRLDLVTSSGIYGDNLAVTMNTTAEVSAPLVQFPPQLLQTKSRAQKVTLTNMGASPLNISGITITGGERRDFSRTSTCGSQLAARASCAVHVFFTPSFDYGPIEAYLAISDDAAGSPQSVLLDGTGTVLQVVPPNELDFGSIAVGQTSGPLTVTLTNRGNRFFPFGRIEIEGQDLHDFLISGKTCKGGLEPFGGSCKVHIEFKPTTTGTREAELEIFGVGYEVPPSVVILRGTGTN
jgi:hypothetical protein